uniref:RNA-directed DNA polymerase n=1 Tax=Thiolapillus sp. TaxID=2017437 RepID=UPI003AF6F7D4
QRKISDKISMEQWSQHFQTIFRTSESHSDTPVSDSDGDDILFNELNVPITDHEVRVALSSLKSRKASGHDNVTAEMLKASDNIAVTFFTKLFNKFFSEGRYPEQWTRSVIVPLFKKGDKDIPNNYRGISLLSVASKCYTTVLRNRLTKWMDDHEKVVEAQAGFRKGYSTIDHIYTLSAVIEKYLSRKGGKLYVAFIDLQKAFDSVNRTSLFLSLVKAGLSGPFLNAIKAMYRSVISCVRVNNKVTEFFLLSFWCQTRMYSKSCSFFLVCK